MSLSFVSAFPDNDRAGMLGTMLPLPSCPSSIRRRGIAEMVTAMVISGTIGWFVVRSGQPLVELLFWRCAFGAATLLPICAALGLLRGWPSARVLGWSALGGAAIVVNWLLIFGAFAHTSISVATAVYNTQPFMLVALGALLFREQLRASQLAWLVLAFGGVLLIAQARPATASPQGHYLLGVAMALGAAFFYAVAAAATKRLAGTAPHLVALIQVLVGTALLTPFARLLPLPADAGTWATLATMGVVYTGLVYILLYGAIQKLTTQLSGALSFIYPVVAIVVDDVAFGHRLAPLQVAAAAAILCAAAAMTLNLSPPGWTWFQERRKGMAP